MSTAKPMSKPYYSLDEAYQRLNGLGADIYSGEDLLLMARDDRIQIGLLIKEPIEYVELGPDFPTIIHKNSLQELQDISKSLDCAYNEMIIELDKDSSVVIFEDGTRTACLVKKNSPGVLVFKESLDRAMESLRPLKSFVAMIFANEYQSNIEQSSKDFIVYPVSTNLNSPNLRNLEFNLNVVMSKNWLRRDRMSLDKYECFIYEGRSHLCIDTLSFSRGYLDFYFEDLLSGNESIPFQGVLSDKVIKQAMDDGNFVIEARYLAEYEQRVLGFDHGLELKIENDNAETKTNLEEHNKTRAQNAQKQSVKIKKRYDEIAKENTQWGKTAICQTLKEEFKVSLSTVFNRLKK